MLEITPDTRRAEVLFGRDRELDQLTRTLEAVRAGQPRCVVVEGAAGIGKTALIRRFAADQDDVTFVWASGDAGEQTVPFGVADQLLRRSRSRPLPAPAIADDADDIAVGRTILETIGELQRTGPVALVVDDAQWADLGSLRALLFAARRFVTEPVLVILASRTTDLHLVPEGFVRAADPHVTLERIGFDETRALARHRGLLLSTHALRRVHALSAGVPLHLCSLLDDWDTEDGITAPAAYAALVVGRLAECGDSARRLVEAAAVLGDRSSIDDAARVAGVDAPLAGLEDAVERELVRAARRTIEFVHPLIRSAVHDSLGPARLAELHAAAAELAEDESSALVHRAQATAAPDEALASELEAAGWSAAAAGNWLRSADLLGEAGELSPARADRERRILGSVGAFCTAGDLVAARELLPTIRRFDLTAEREYVLGNVAFSDLDVAAARRHFETAWAIRPAENAPLGVWIASQLASCAYFCADAHTQLEWARRAMQLTSISDPANAPAVTKLAIALAMAGRLEDGLALLDRALSSASAAALDLAQAQTARGRLRLMGDDLTGARDDLVAVVDAAVGDSASRSAGLALGRLSFVEYYAGRWKLALSHADRGLATCVDRADNAQVTALRAPAVLVLAARGDWRDAEQHLHAMAVESAGVALPTIYTAFAAAHLAAAKGDAAAVVAAAAPIVALESRDAVDEPGLWPWQGLYAEALVDLGQLDEAERFLAPQEALARRRGRRSLVGRLDRARAKLEAAHGHDELAQDAFARSAEALRDVSMPYEVALTELAHGRFLRRRRQRRDAVEVLANARDRLAAVGALPALQACERELQASGLEPKRPSAKGAGRLTPQEVTVARLVLAGMTNREIAGELMVSAKTVEVHLTNVYAKLEVKSRGQLRARARDGELELSAR